MTTTVRRAGGADAGALADLYWRARQAAVPAIPAPVHSASSVAVWMRDVVLAQRRAWVAVEDGRIVGMLVLDDPDWVDQLYVDPAAQGRGTGTMLLDVAMEELGGAARLWCFQSNTAARRFYERHGFVEVARTAGENEEGAPDVLYRLGPPHPAAASAGAPRT